MEEQSCVLLENGRRISAFASQLPFMRGTALTPDPGIKNRQAPCGACRFLVRAAGLEPARRMAMEPKSIESTNSTTPAYSDQYSTPAAVTQAKIPAAAEKSPPAAKKVSYFPETVIQYKAKNTGILRVGWYRRNHHASDRTFFEVRLL